MHLRLLTILLVVFVLGCFGLSERELCFDDGNCITVEIADTPAQHARGLMYRETLPADRGMLFVFDKEDVYPFWMKNMNSPIDMIWIDKDKTIVHIERSVPPCAEDPCASYNPGVPALYVLEVSANFTLENGITLENRIIL